ncbi:hypothetical protein [Algibacter sp. L4_22]|uniref:hypothetical protein n=1 Tax=Algibacter sp. L4_22 TaxID=2942477 RepID=UPI00201B5E3A|nr:hypothetical protein [Algibacter sp. L4_22]MCL5127993.1 hypothetical protein [Algibacter sp. L4_22]
MENKNLKSEKDYIKMYQQKGFTSNFMMVNHKLVGTETKTEYYPIDITVVAEHRFEGISNPSDMSMLYVIETRDGNKGTVLANYSPASNTSTAEFFKAIPNKNVSQKANIFEQEKQNS